VYTRAIDYSVEAAYQGFTVAEDALSLAQLIQETTPEERTEFLKGMQEFAQRGHLKADEAHKRFMGVRTTIETVCNSPLYRTWTSNGKCADTEKIKRRQRKCSHRSGYDLTFLRVTNTDLGVNR